MAETSVATDVHQALDIHRGFTTQVTLNGEQRSDHGFSRSPSVRSLTFRVRDVACFADFASTCASDTKNCSQTNQRVLAGILIPAIRAYFRPLKLLKISLDAVYASVQITEQRLAANYSYGNFLNRC
jgi:hypothetical protein